MSASPRLRNAWRALTRAAGADDAAADAVWRELDGRYTESHRAYHTWSHIDHVHQVMEWILTRVVASRPPVEFAVFFHDAVFRTTAPLPGEAPGDNETASAQFARTACSLMALPDDLADDVARLVLATRDHRPDDREEAVLCDADLAILAADARTYDLYRRAIRVEYANVDDVTFRHGRSAVLQDFLQRRQIYSTSLMRDRGESVARTNLTRELQLLQQA